MTDTPKKKFSIEEAYSLDEIDFKDWDIISPESLQWASLKKIKKTFKVANYSYNTSNSIIKNMEIEIEGIAHDNDEFWKNLSNVFK